MEYIINNSRHPHYQCIGTISEDEKIPDTGQYIMRLTTCMHGVDRCGVQYHELNRLG
jgi:hypothetical protein